MFGLVWRLQVAESRVADVVYQMGGCAKLDVIIEEMLKNEKIRESYATTTKKGKLHALMLKAVYRSRRLGAVSYSDDGEKKFLVYVIWGAK